MYIINNCDNKLFEICCKFIFFTSCHNKLDFIIGNEKKVSYFADLFILHSIREI